MLFELIWNFIKYNFIKRCLKICFKNYDREYCYDRVVVLKVGFVKGGKQWYCLDSGMFWCFFEKNFLSIYIYCEILGIKVLFIIYNIL